jgi:hypothetical protein
MKGLQHEVSLWSIPQAIINAAHQLPNGKSINQILGIIIIANSGLLLP